MLYIDSGNYQVSVTPDLQIASCKFLGNQRIELQGRSEASSYLLKVFHFKYRRRRPIKLENFDGRLENVFTRYPHLLALETTEEANSIIPARDIRPATLLILPFQDQTRVAK